MSYKDGMRVPGRVFGDDALLEHIKEDQALEQVANVAFLPGIVGHSLAMPDIHWGYGFPHRRGGCNRHRPRGRGLTGGRGLRHQLRRPLVTHPTQRVRGAAPLRELMNTLIKEVPTGLGGGGRLRLDRKQVDQVLRRGAGWAVEQGYGVPDDLEVTEDRGCIAGADPQAVGDRPKTRGAPSIGHRRLGQPLLGSPSGCRDSGPGGADAMGITELGQVAVLIHCGSRGLGHQVCTDSLKVIEAASDRYGIRLPDRQLAAVPVESPEGQAYLGAMRAAANFAWANRQCLAHWIRLAFSQVFGRPWRELGMAQVYDVSHNMAKIEEHLVDGKRMSLCVHRKGATRAFPPGHPETPERYRDIGQPVLVPGDMGRYSFLAVAGPRAMEQSFGSTCHGAGRAESRSKAKKLLKGRDIQQELADRGIIAIGHNWASLAEEAPIAYKDVADVMRVADQAGLCRPVVRFKPLGVIKG